MHPAFLEPTAVVSAVSAQCSGCSSHTVNREGAIASLEERGPSGDVCFPAETQLGVESWSVELLLELELGSQLPARKRKVWLERRLSGRSTGCSSRDPGSVHSHRCSPSAHTQE